MAHKRGTYGHSQHACSDGLPPSLHVHALTWGTGHHIRESVLPLQIPFSVFINWKKTFFFFYFNNLYLLVFHAGLDEKLSLHVSTCFQLMLCRQNFEKQRITRCIDVVWKLRGSVFQGKWWVLCFCRLCQCLVLVGRSILWKGVRVVRRITTSIVLSRSTSWTRISVK